METPRFKKMLLVLASNGCCSFLEPPFIASIQQSLLAPSYLLNTTECFWPQWEWCTTWASDVCPMCYANGNILWKTTSLEESNIDKVCFTIDIVCGKRPCQSIDVSKSTYRNYRKLFYCTGNLDVQVLELFFLI